MHFTLLSEFHSPSLMSHQAQYHRVPQWQIDSSGGQGARVYRLGNRQSKQSASAFHRLSQHSGQVLTMTGEGKGERERKVKVVYN